LRIHLPGTSELEAKQPFSAFGSSLRNGLNSCNGLFDSTSQTSSPSAPSISRRCLAGLCYWLPLHWIAPWDGPSRSTSPQPAISPDGCIHHKVRVTASALCLHTVDVVKNVFVQSPARAWSVALD